MIVIKTPQPDIEERLVLVPVRRIVPESRDATPDDLARAGWVPLAAFVGPLDLLTPPTLDGVLEAIHSVREAVATECDRQHDEAMARAEKAERERDEAREFARVLTVEHDEARAELARIAQALGTVHEAEGHAPHPGTVEEMLQAIRSRDTETRGLTDTIARLTAPTEGEPTDEELGCIARNAGPYRDLLGAASYRAIYRLGVAHERARHVKPRATDEELFALAGTAYSHGPAEHEPSLEKAIRAVAAHVRGEQCLVAQAVEMGWYIYLCPQKNEPSKWDIETGRVIAGRSDGGAILHGVPAADAPATLARLLGEVKP